MPSLLSRKLKHIPSEITVPGDKSISHRAAMFSALCEGTTVVENFLPSEDCLCSLHAMVQLGAKFEVLEEASPGKPTKLRIQGRGMKLQPPAGVIDCGNSGTTMRLLAGILAGQNFECSLAGDSSLSSRPMKRVADPLNMMGAGVKGVGEKACAPLTVRGGDLRSMTYELPVASAQVKSAILLAGLQASGKTTVIEPVATRDHTERLLSHFHVKTVRDGTHISIYGNQKLQPEDLYVPGDISSAAFWLVAAAATPGARLTLRNVGLNPTRTGVLNVLVRMGAQINDFVEVGEGEPRGNIIIRGTDMNATLIRGAEIPNIIDEIPILAVAAALARGNTIIRDAQELRVKETDRIAAVAHNLRLMGVAVEEFPDGMEIHGGRTLTGAKLSSFGDHRIAMAFAIAGLFAEGVTEIENTDCIATSYPGFEQHLASFLTEPRFHEPRVHVISKVPSSVADRLSQSNS